MTPDPMLQAIIESPDDDTPRLIYADWLEENERSERCPCTAGSLTRAGLASVEVSKVTMRIEQMRLAIGDIQKSDLSDHHKHEAMLAIKSQIDAAERSLVTICTNCQGTGYASNRFYEAAEFIRLQIHHGSRMREVELLTRNFTRWAGALPRAVCLNLVGVPAFDDRHTDEIGVYFKRGFMEVIAARMMTVVRNLPLLKTQPIRTIRVMSDAYRSDDGKNIFMDEYFGGYEFYLAEVKKSRDHRGRFCRGEEIWKHEALPYVFEFPNER